MSFPEDVKFDVPRKRQAVQIWRNFNVDKNGNGNNKKKNRSSNIKQHEFRRASSERQLRRGKNNYCQMEIASKNYSTFPNSESFMDCKLLAYALNDILYDVCSK